VPVWRIHHAIGFGADELLSAGAARVLDSPAEVKL
jgi:hypothetical protein